MPFFSADIENKSILPFENEELNNYIHPLSLDKHLITNPPATFFARIAGSEKDLIIIDKSIDLENNSLVALYIEGEFVLRRVEVNKDGTIILPDNATIWGRVTYYIQSV